MTRQRPSDRDRDTGPGGWGRGLLGLAFALTASCAGEPALLYGPERPIGTGGGPTQVPALVGEWEVTLIVEVDEDFQTWTTRWRFDANGACQFTQIIRSVLEGVDRETLRPCTWAATGTEVRISWTDETGGTSVLPYSFAGLDTSRLVLQDVEYRRRP